MATAPSFDFINQSTPELRRYLGRAIAVGRTSSYGRGYSFSVLLLTFLTCDDEVSRWFQSFTGWLRDDPTAIRIKDGLRKMGLSDGVNESNLASIRAISNEDAEKEFLVSEMPPDLSGSAEGILRRAVDYMQNDVSAAPASQQTNSFSLDVRHIMGVFIYDPAGHDKDIRIAHINPEDWSISFLREVIRKHYRYELAYWMEQHVSRFHITPDLGPELTPSLDLSEQLMGYCSDTVNPKDPDLIGIDEDVNPLAALIAARSTQPPLSIGVFGDWGSGKTFFINRLKRRISEIAAKACEANKASKKPPLQKDIDFYKHIVQIDFNAWHYVSGKLWAGLAENIFNCLQENNVSTLDFKSSRARRMELDEMISQLETTKPTTSSAVSTAQTNVEDVQAQLERARQSAAVQSLNTGEILTVAASDRALRSDFEQAFAPLFEALQIDATKKSLTELYGTVKVTQAAASKGQLALLPLLFQRERLLYLLLTLLIAPVIAVLVGVLVRQWVQSELISQIGSILSGLSALAGGLAVWLRTQAATATDWIGRVEKGIQDFERAAADKVRMNPEVVRLEEQLRMASATLSDAQQAHEKVLADLERNLCERETLEPPRLINALIQERMESGDYRKHLGITALIRRDFEKLEREIVDQNLGLGADNATEDTEENVKINRIVLYIDDLDRCPPDIVTQVLQAVHLLLAFKLFVVVVAVDARWVSRALQKNYPELLRPTKGTKNTNGSPAPYTIHTASPHDYLEKIFQIPLWLEPIDAPGTRNLIHGLLAGAISTQKAEASKQGGESSTSLSNVTTPTSQTVKDGANISNPPIDTITSSDTQAQLENIELVAKNLEITPDELATMDQLAIVLGRSPRAVKRFVNCYRLIKASLAQTKPDSYTDDGSYRPIMLLLAVLTGMPDLSATFYKTILGRGGSVGTLKILVEQDLTEKMPDQKRLMAWLDSDDGTTWRDMPIERLKQYTERVARYSFRVDQL